ncbi:hypothetical protein H4684_003075 [Desulfomicrobium macestii]|uniref:Glycosyltransferase family 1 protein n=1 Tax=Desulfomicrobium macestii TaxID=90731 RepID=A0ABR9H6U5_9BACT|nr:glycosyltransferase family 1 protein [Desulfomicrobium macestii]MBE1426410.1 hypothetical protein [Desulfomicrobium macestii]
MRILMIAINDPAGTAIEFTKAINAYTEHSCRLITKEIRYNFMFEKDLHLPWLDEAGWAEVEELLRTSDVFHFHMTADEDIELGPFRPRDFMKGKIIVHHHHGHPDFRGNPEKYRQKYKERGRRNLLVSTPDLLKLLPEATWQPNLVPVNNPLYTPLENKPEEPIIICHSPTRKDLKNTEEFILATKELMIISSIPVEMRIIENTPHKECLRLKRESHILFDHLQGYYGISSLEGLSQGLTVIANLDDWNKSHIREYFETDALPWIDCKPENICNILLNTTNAYKKMKRYSESRKFMSEIWNEKKVINILFQTIGEKN